MPTSCVTRTSQMEKPSLHDCFHMFAIPGQPILEIPIKESTGKRIKRIFKVGDPRPFRRFYARSFTHDGLLTTDRLDETKEFIASISSATAPCWISSIRLIKPTILADFFMDFEAWGHLLSAIKDTVTEIHLENVQIRYSAVDQSILPIPIPNLRRLVVDGVKVHLTRLLIDNLTECPKLESVSFEVDIEKENAECLLGLNRSMAEIDIHYWIWLRRDNANLIFDDEDGFKGLDLIADKIKGFSLVIDCWDDRLPFALQQMVNRCQNLTKLAIKKLDPCKKVDGADLKLELALIPLFSTPERAAKLVELNWAGECDNEILRSIFSHCLRLDTLAISDCPQLSDMSFFDWWYRSPKPHVFKIRRYDSDDTIRSITASSRVKGPGNQEMEECDCTGLLFMELMTRQVPKRKPSCWFR